jgi:hypothetical protein
MAARTAQRGLSTSDLESIKAALVNGRRPKVVFTQSAGQIAGQQGQVVELADPAVNDDWVVVRFGRDELPFSPTDLAMAPKPARKAVKAATAAGAGGRAEASAVPGAGPPLAGAVPVVPSPREESSMPRSAQSATGKTTATGRAAGTRSPVASGDGRAAGAKPTTDTAAGAAGVSAAGGAAGGRSGGPVTSGAPPAAASAGAAAKEGAGGATVKAGRAKADPAAAPAVPAGGAAPAKPKPARKPKPPAALTVTLAYADGEWTVAAQQGSRSLAKPYLIRAAEALKMVGMLDVPGVHEAVEEIVAAARAQAEAEAERLRAELAEIEERLAELREAG